MNIKIDLYQELTQRLLPFWMSLKDDAHGGFYGRKSYDLKIIKDADKGCILNSRMMWFFAKAYLLLKDESVLEAAKHAYRFLANYCWDDEYGGIYWSLAYDGRIADDTKHTYNQAFGIYALSAYAQATGEREPLERAFSLFDCIETKCRDEGGYLEAFTRDFQPTSNEKLSENGVIAVRTMNTLLHVFEGYAGLYEVTKDARVGIAMRRIVELYLEHVYNPVLKRQEVFFDADYHPLIDLQSYGHDIESAWLLDWGCALLGDEALSARLNAALSEMVDCVYRLAFDGDSLVNECEDGKVDTTRVWWVQAEGMVGFMNAWQHQPEKVEYAQAVFRLWAYIQDKFIDHRAGGEWFWDLDANGVPVSKKDIVEPWKCPYHNGRMCIEMIRRLDICSIPNIEYANNAKSNC